jgi:hypothetical protein
MIHFTVATPFGIDSIVFSFLKRLAALNGHACIDVPLEQLDEQNPQIWIEDLRRSRHHHFLVGYRYPPPYWKVLVQSADTVCLLADPDGIARQVSQIHQDQKEGELVKSLRSSVQAIEHALEATLNLVEWIIAQDKHHNYIIPTADSFMMDPSSSFYRLERFYQLAGVDIATSCRQAFGKEAMALLRQIEPVSADVSGEIHRLLTLQDVSPSRLAAICDFFGFID